MNDGLNKHIARFPDAVKSGILLTYLTLVRPLDFCIVSALESASGGDTDAEEQRIYLFSRRGKHVSGQTLCEWFKGVMSELQLGKLSVSQYRQYQEGMV
jgi:hypothetical protein